MARVPSTAIPNATHDIIPMLIVSLCSPAFDPGFRGWLTPAAFGFTATAVAPLDAGTALVFPNFVETRFPPVVRVVGVVGVVGVLTTAGATTVSFSMNMVAITRR